MVNGEWNFRMGPELELFNSDLQCVIRGKRIGISVITYGPEGILKKKKKQNLYSFLITVQEFVVR